MRLAAFAVASVLALAAAAPAAHAEGELFLYNWTNYFPPDLQKKFEADTGIKVTLDTYDSNETLLAKLQAGGTGYDVIVPSDYMVATMIEAGLLQPIAAKSMANAKNINAPFDQQWFDPERTYTAPYMWGTTGFSYDSKRVPGGQLEDSWKSFFAPPAELNGQVAALNDEVELYNAAALYLGIDKCTESAEDGKRILEVLEAQKPVLAMYQSDGTIERMIAGEVIMHQQWNGAAHRTREKLPSAVFVYPKEGLNFWQDNFAVPVGAPNVENAKIFINWMMDPQNIAAASNFTGYMNGIKGSEAFMDESLRSDPAVVMPAEFADRLSPAKNCSDAARELRNKVWTRLKK
ncbi:MAG: extracellular solute-binding protein [Geminicoccaceae bacterium]